MIPILQLSFNSMGFICDVCKFGLVFSDPLIHLLRMLSNILKLVLILFDFLFESCDLFPLVLNFEVKLRVRVIQVLFHIFDFSVISYLEFMHLLILF